MGLLSPHFTLGGYYWWKVVRKNKYFVLQQHKAGPPIWFAPQFRILLRCNNYLIAEASTKEEIDADWEYIIEQIKLKLKDKLLSQDFDVTHLFLAFFNELSKKSTSQLQIKPPESNNLARTCSFSVSLSNSEPNTQTKAKPFRRRHSFDSLQYNKEEFDENFSRSEMQKFLSSASLQFPGFIPISQINTESEINCDQNELDILKLLNISDPVHSKYECFLMESDLVAGSLLLTSNLILFFHNSSKTYKHFKLESYLDKLGTLRWNRRWCVLNNDYLHYYNSSNTKEAYFPKGSIPISEIKSVGFLSARGRDNCFQVKLTDHQEFFFSADSPTQLNQWMDALKYAIEFYKRVIIPFSEVKKIEIIKHNSSLLLNDSISIQTQQEQHIFSFLTHLKVAYDLMNRLWKNTTHTGRKSSGSLSKQEEESNEMFKDEVIQKKEEEDFRKLFKLSQDELIEYYACSLSKSFPIPGQLYITNKHVGFYSKILGLKNSALIPYQNIDSIARENSLLFFPGSISIKTKNGLDIIFSSFINRDTVFKLISKQIESFKNRYTSVSPLQSYVDNFNEPLSLPITSDIGSMNVTILTIGSRGDVQPYLAFARGLKEFGHTVTVATHPCFKTFVEENGIQFASLGGDPKKLMELCVKNGMFSPSFLKEALANFRGFVDELFEFTLKACQNSQAIISAPNVMSAYHVAEKLNLPLIGAFTMPWTRTSQYPHPFAVSETQLGGMYNCMTYLVIASVFWQPLRNQVNSWREKHGLQSIGIQENDLWYQGRVPFLYCFSPQVVPKPADWGSEINVCGYWFLETQNLNGWTPPQDLIQFLEEDSTKPIIYIGFGSIVVDDPDGLTQIVLDAIQASEVKAVLMKGWGDLAKGVQVPPNVYSISQIPHDWLFPRVSAVVHHGGAGTVACGLRNGKPEIIVPFFGDQYFWAQRIVELGVGAYVSSKNITSELLGEAISHVLHDTGIKKKAEQIGQNIRKENGVSNAINAFHIHVNNARIKPRLQNTN